MNYSLGEYIFIILFVWATVTSVIATIIAIIDIWKSEFFDPRDKKKWLYVVLATGIIGAVFFTLSGARIGILGDGKTADGTQNTFSTGHQSNGRP